MPPTEPGEQPRPEEHGRLLQAPPGARYARPEGATEAADGPSGSALPGPLATAVLTGVIGGVLLVLVGAVASSTTGLLFIAGALGAVVGLVLSRAAAPRGAVRPTPRGKVAWLAIGIALLAVAGAAVATWLVARDQGGTLELVDYLLTTFGPIVPGEAILAVIAARWAAMSGPIGR